MKPSADADEKYRVPYIFLHKKHLKEYDEDQEKLACLEEEYARIMNELDELQRQGKIRNTTLAGILEIMHVSENRYSGIPTIFNEMEAAGLPAPEFLTRGGEFKVILRNNIAREVSVENMETESIETKKNNRSREENLLVFCKVPRSREEIEITEFMGFSRYYVMEKIVKPLLESGQLEMTIPDKPKSKKQRYVRK